MQTISPDVLKQAWASSSEDILEQFGVSTAEGLHKRDVRKLRKVHGLNALRKIKEKSAWQILLEQLKSLIVVLLCGAAVLSFALYEWMDGVAILVVILINTAIGFLTELKAIRSMESLRRMERITARVRRGGQIVEIPASQLVPGDIVVIEGGDVVSADLRLIRTSKLQIDESMLTGESLAVSKQCERIAEDVVLAERTNMLFKGTAVTRGSGEGVVVATGMSTELGRISALVAEAQPSVTPLERRLDELGRKLLWVTLAVIVLVAAAGIARGKDVVIMIEMAIALAVAAIPEGLPIVATVALARGMIRMARRSALINRLAAVETLGGISVICTDKTGTLTENRMTVTRIVLSTGEIDLEPPNVIADRFTSDVELPQPTINQVLLEALEVAVLCNNAFLSEGPESRLKGVGDPLEVALLVAAANAGIQRKDLNNRLPETREEAFDSDLKMMATFHKDKGRYRVAVKGAPEVVLEVCSCVRTDEGLQRLDEKTRQWWGRWNAVMAEQGLRVLALATKTAESDRAEPYEDLTLVGLVAMTDPPRDDVRAAIDLCHKAGIKVVMVTGDQPSTAAAIASSVGLVERDYSQVITSKDIKPISEMTDKERKQFLEASIFARVSPKQKLDLIDIHQQAGSVVAMTGDGVNDAPALKKADIGVAMGQRGTQVAREAADIVLQDDAFSTIVVAVEQGRVIFGNIRKFVLYLLSCNVSEVMIVFLASIVNAPLPILPLQILFLNLVTDVFPALALGVGAGDPEIMNRKPRDPKEPLLTSRQWFAVFGYGMLITLVVLSSFAVALLLLDMSAQEAVTISFLTLAFSQLWHIFNMRDRGTKLFQNEVFQNKYAWAAIILCSGLLISAVYLPIVSAALKLTDPGIEGWVLVILASLVPCFLGQLFKWITKSKAAPFIKKLINDK